MPSSYRRQEPVSLVRADLSDQRLATVQSYLNGERAHISDLSEGARVMLTVGLFICNDVGFIKQAALKAAMADRSIVQVARNALREAGY